MICIVPTQECHISPLHFLILGWKEVIRVEIIWTLEVVSSGPALIYMFDLKITVVQILLEEAHRKSRLHLNFSLLIIVSNSSWFIRASSPEVSQSLMILNGHPCRCFLFLFRRKATTSSFLLIWRFTNFKESVVHCMTFDIVFSCKCIAWLFWKPNL